MLLKREKEEELLGIFVMNVSNLLALKEDPINYQKSFSKSTYLDDKY